MHRKDHLVVSVDLPVTPVRADRRRHPPLPLDELVRQSEHDVSLLEAPG